MNGFVSCIFLLCAVSYTLAYQQSVNVKGSLTCGQKGTGNTWVKILNKRTGFDDQKEAQVNSDGSFDVTLNVDRTFGLTPELHIYTDCNDEVLGIQKGCQRKIVMKIPDSYVIKGSSGQAYNVGSMNMETKMNDEERDCSTKRSFGGGNGAQTVGLSMACFVSVLVAAVVKFF